MTISTESKRKTLNVAVAGNPNSGKSTLINTLSGSRLHVGNWPGVTVEKREAFLEFQGQSIKLVDLPGAYSLSPYTQEEIIARDYLAREKPDVIINVVDATNIERNLYLTLQLIDLDIPTIVALNIYDEAEKRGYKIDTTAMEEMLGVKVVPTVSTKNKGLVKLLEGVVELTGSLDDNKPKKVFYGEDIEPAVNSVESAIMSAHPELEAVYPLRWLAIKLMENDTALLRELNLPADFDFSDSEPLAHLKKAHGEDIESIMADARHALSSGLTREVLAKPEFTRRELTEKIDAIVLNRALGLPIFFIAMWLMFKFTFDVSTPFIDWIDGVTAGPMSRWTQGALETIGASPWMVSLATDGVLGGVGFVLVFVPVIAAMMFFITLLEGSGYMARAAFVMDRAMHAMGLHGKSFIPMLIGFGCNVPAIYATRTLEHERDKALTALLVPLMSCSARLPVYVLFIGAFFPQNAGTVLWFIYILGMTLAVVMGMIFKRTLFRGEEPLFIMELPPYRMPTFKSLMIHTWEKVKHFIIKAGTVIFAASILVWFLLNLPWGVEQTKDSYLGKIGHTISPVFEPVGFGNWEAGSALITGIVAKEVIVGTLGEIYSMRNKEDNINNNTFAEDVTWIAGTFVDALGEVGDNVFSTFGIATITAEEDEDTKGLKPLVRGSFTPLSALSFMAFVLLYMPCLVTAAAFKSEFGSWKWFGVAVVYEFSLAWVVAFVIFQGGTALGFGG